MNALEIIKKINKLICKYDATYKIINKISIASEKLNILKNDKNKILSLYQMMERLNVNNIYMNNITQEELATRMGYQSKSSINKIEKGINDIPQNKIVKFAEVLSLAPV